MTPTPDRFRQPRAEAGRRLAANLALVPDILAIEDEAASPVPAPTLDVAEVSLDDLWAAVAASLTAAEEHKMAIYRGEGVQPAAALEGIQKHIAAGLAARVMYDRLATPDTETAE